MNKLFSTGLLAIGLALPSFAASPYYTTNFPVATLGIDHIGIPGASSNAASTAIFALNNNEEVGVTVACNLGAADTTSPTATFVFFTAPDAYATNNSPKHSVSLALNGASVVKTNFNVYVGSQGWFGLTNISSTTTNYLTNIVVKLSIKENRHGKP